VKPLPDTGFGIARFLRTAWRAQPDPVDTESLGAQLSLASVLLDTGCGALGWWKIRGTSAATLPAASALQQAFRVHALESVRRRRDLEHVLVHFNSAGLEPVLFKGWTLTGLYAHPALRPFGDIDVLVDVKDESLARRVIAGLPEALRELVDLDMRVLERFLPDREFGELSARTKAESVGQGRCRLLAPEDHLRLLCLHQLDHGGWRPLWLCDVAAFIERLPPSFQWKLCLRGNSHLSDGVLSLASLAAELLGARLPMAIPRNEAPPWFRDAILRAWAGGYQAPPDSLHSLHRLGFRRAAAAVRARWPDPVTATLHLRAPFRGVPRLPLQMLELGRRAVRFVFRSRHESGSGSLSAVGAGGQGVMP
jgi:Uncharacterised nucleotidyltransferase